jgi:hypothetical protein
MCDEFWHSLFHVKPLKCLFPLGFVCLLATTARTETVPASKPAAAGDQGGTVLSLLDTEFIHVDLKAISADKGSFGIDYKVEFSKTVIKETGDKGSGEMGRQWDVLLRSTGFLTANPDKNDINSLITEAAFKANPLWRVAPSGDGAIPPELLLDPEGLKRWMNEHGAAFVSPLSVYAQASLKHETTQNGNVYDFAAGAALGLTTGYINRFLDAPFALLRIPSKTHPESNNGPRQVDVSIGYDFVTGRHIDASTAASKDESDAHRIVYKAEWETGVLRGDRIILSFNGHQQFAGPAGGNQMHPFFQARYEHLLFEKENAKASFAINYTAGELPPNFNAGHVIGAGFSIEWE